MVSLEKSQLLPDPFEYDIGVKISVPNLGEYDHCYILSGDYIGPEWIPYDPGIQEIFTVPWHMVSSLIQLSTEPRYEYSLISSPVLIHGQQDTFKLRVQNLKPGTKQYSILLSTPFGSQNYQFSLSHGQLRLARRGYVWQEEARLPVLVQKTIVPTNGVVRINYQVENLAETELRLFFGSEWNFYLLPGEWEEKADRILLLGGKVELDFSPPAEIWHFPLETLSQSEAGYDIIHQGMCFLPHWRASLLPSEKFSVTITLRIEHER